MVVNISKYRNRTWLHSSYPGSAFNEALLSAIHITKNRLTDTFDSLILPLSTVSRIRSQNLKGSGVRKVDVKEVDNPFLRRSKSTPKKPKNALVLTDKQRRAIVETAILLHCVTEYGMDELDVVMSTEQTEAHMRNLLKHWDIWADHNLSKAEKAAWTFAGFDLEHDACKKKSFQNCFVAVVYQGVCHTTSNANDKVPFVFSMINEAVIGISAWYRAIHDVNIVEGYVVDGEGNEGADDEGEGSGEEDGAADDDGGRGKGSDGGDSGTGDGDGGKRQAKRRKTETSEV